MVSKRKFFSIAIMMFILLFLFQFSMVMRDRQNAYDVNSGLTVKKADGQNAWKQEDTDLKTLVKNQESYVVFVGDAKSDMGVAVERWCAYTKRNLLTYSSLLKYTAATDQVPEIVILESEKYADASNLSTLEDYVKTGSIVIFGSLEDANGIKKNQEMMNFLGIKKVVTDKVKLSGIKLFEGLLLGGEVVYQPDTAKEKKERQDLEFQVPWYQVGSGTKTYMVGLLDEKKMKKNQIENEDLPTLIWRNGIDNGSVYAVCGDYLKDSTAIGILDGMVSEASTYTIYPVVNAQNLSMVNFPGFADENKEELTKLYSRSVVGINRDIMWPALVSTAEQSKLKMTCFIQPQSDYLDEIEPDSSNLIFYLKQMKEQNAEAGLSLQYKRASSMSDKITRDGEFFASADSNYEYGAAFVDEKQIPLVLNMQGTTLLKSVGTLVCDYTEDYPLLSYCGDSITLQEVTNNGMNYTYGDDMRMRSIQTALGYTNVSLNMGDIYWPKDAQDRWQVMQEKFTSNLLTYWKQFSYFTATTLSESNTRTRIFLNLDYSYKEDDEGAVQLQTSEKGSWFLLRTHGAEVESTVGGSWQKIEDNTYLIYAEQDSVRIKLKQPKLHYYPQD